MKNISKKIVKLTILGLVIVLFQACSVKVPISDTKTSNMNYSNSNNDKKMNVQFESSLNKSHSVSTGKLTKVFLLEHNNKTIDANSFIKASLEKELRARNLILNFDEISEDKLILEDFEILTHRASGFSPLVTISTLKVKLKSNNESKIIVSMIKRAKVPVWSIDEIHEPCYNEPTTLLIKEIVAKINRLYFGYKFTDEYIKQLESKILNPENERLTYIDVYELGFSNNLKVVSFLKELTNSNAQYIRLAAISSIGTLGDATQFDFLVSLNKNSKMWQDRAMALKSIGDLGTEEAYNYLKERKSFWKGQTTQEALWNLKILNLYLD